jgi:hypothetical protein
MLLDVVERTDMRSAAHPRRCAIAFNGSKNETINGWNVKHGATPFTLINHHRHPRRAIAWGSGAAVICI